MDASASLRKKIGNGLYLGIAIFVLCGLVTMLLPTVGYFLKLITGIIFLVVCCKRSETENWIGLFVYEAIIFVIAVCSAAYIIVQQAHGLAALESLGAFVLSGCASVVFFLLVLVSGLICMMKLRA